LGLVHT
jgi:hypothetical protein